MLVQGGLTSVGLQDNSSISFSLHIMGNAALLGLHANNEEKWRQSIYGPEGRTIKEEIEEQRFQLQLDVKQPEENAPGIRIEGAVGMYACHINHPFVRTKTMYNERPLYRSLVEENHWLRYASCGIWMVSSTVDKEDDSSDGFCKCGAVGLFEPYQAIRWYVLGEKKAFRTQTRVKVRAMTSEEIMHDGRAIQEALPSKISFQGAGGMLAYKINGLYMWKVPRGESQIQNKCGRKLMFWRCKSKTSTSKNRSVLVFDAEQRWIVVQGTQVLAYCESTGLKSPVDATRWHICNLARTFSVQSSVTVTPVDSNQNNDWQADQQDVTPPSSPRQESKLDAVFGIERKKSPVPQYFGNASTLSRIPSNVALNKAIENLLKMKSSYSEAVGFIHS